MPTKRAPIVKALRRFIADAPPENLAPWKEPNAKMFKIIRKTFRGRLEESVMAAQQAIGASHLAGVLRRAAPK
jgi:hypothetical protein